MKAAVCIVVLIVLALPGCGKKARFLDPPDNPSPPYPKHYPPPDAPGTHL